MNYKKFAGVGLKNAFTLSLFVMLVIVGLKVVFAKAKVKGLTELILTV